VGSKMMVHILGWEWIFQMDVVGVVIVVEVKGRDNLELSMEDNRVEMDNVAKGKVCSSYF